MNLLTSMRYLVALNEHKHFGRAAKACHITQPALSNALRALENEFKVVIVKRDRSFAGLTPEGERVLASAHYLLHEHAKLQQDLGGEAHQPNGPVRIGAVPTAIPIAARFAAMLQSRHPGIVPIVVSLSSLELEQGLEALSIDLAFGYTERMRPAGARLTALAQYTEHYFLLRRAAKIKGESLQMGVKMRWKEAARLPLCLLTPDMHNRTIVDRAFATAGATVSPAIETNSIMTMALSVVAGSVCSVMPGALVGVMRGYRELEALALTGPDVLTPIGLMSNSVARPSRALQAAMALAQDGAWLRHAAAHSGLLVI
jgi:DNA-binding transcriptional LysR family regulator